MPVEVGHTNVCNKSVLTRLESAFIDYGYIEVDYCFEINGDEFVLYMTDGKSVIINVPDISFIDFIYKHCGLIPILSKSHLNFDGRNSNLYYLLQMDDYEYGVINAIFVRRQ